MPLKYPHIGELALKNLREDIQPLIEGVTLERWLLEVSS